VEVDARLIEVGRDEGGDLMADMGTDAIGGPPGRLAVLDELAVAFAGVMFDPATTGAVDDCDVGTVDAITPVIEAAIEFTRRIGGVS
jgi:hypothetical protein